MQKLDKKDKSILSTKYKTWLDKLNASGEDHDGAYRYYYNDIAYNLYSCQRGVCAYTEMYICTPALYRKENWIKGRYVVPDEKLCKKTDHLGQLEHFDSKDKVSNHWNWDNLFMVHASINSKKSGTIVYPFLKPDLDEYSPEKYFKYDEETHEFTPNPYIKNEEEIKQIQHMIDNVLFLNQGCVKRYRTNYINNIKFRKQHGQETVVEEFFTSVKWTLEDL